MKQITGRAEHGTRLLVATLCVAGSMVAVLTTPAEALPPGWHYELISPADPGGADVTGGEGARDSDHAWLSDLVPIEPGQHTGNVTIIAATRTSAGWTRRDLADPARGDGKSYSFSMEATSKDLSRVVVSSCQRVLLGCVGNERIEAVGEHGTRTTLLDVPRSGGVSDPIVKVAAASEDARRIVVEVPPGLTPLDSQDTHSFGTGLYIAEAGHLEFLGYDENGAVLDCGAVLASGHVTGFEQTGLSTQGTTSVYTSPDPDSGCPDPPALYVRQDGHSVKISTPQGGSADQGAVFAGMSGNGQLVYFVTANKIANGDTDDAADIYRYDVTTGQTTRITSGPNVLSAVVSPDGEWVYMTTSEPIDGHGVSGNCNLFVYHAGAFRLIASLAPDAVRLGDPLENGGPSRITPDGKHLLFESNDAAVGPPNNGNYQIYQYSYDDDVVRCVSCHPDGSSPTTSTLYSTFGANRGAYVRLQSDDGRTVAFETSESLVADDTDQGQDVYLWQDGKVSRVTTSDTAGIGPGMLVSTTADGNGVLFLSTARLSPDIEQDSVKLYMARKGAGFPVARRAPECVGDECQGAASTGSGTPTLASELLRPKLGRKDSSHKRDRLHIRKLGSRASMLVSRSGKLPVRFFAPRGGKVSLKLSGRIGGRWVTIGRKAKHLSGSGIATVAVRIGPRARRILVEDGTLRVRISLTQPHAEAATKAFLLQ